MNQLDPINAAIAIASVIFGPVLATYIGPYSLIMVAATVGASWALRRQKVHLTALETISYFTLINFTAVIVTVGIATLIANWFAIAEPNWLLAIVALVVGGVGSDWPRVLKWVFIRALRVFERRAGVRND